MNIIRTLLIASAAFGSISAASAQTIGVPAGSYVSDPLHTNVLWSVSHFGTSTYIGRFDGTQATLEIDPTDATKSKLTATIDPASVNVNYSKDDKDFAAEIESDMFLDAAKFDEITFVSTEIKATGENTGTVTGDLTFHGVTKPVTLDVKMNGALNPHPMTKKPVVGFSATGTIKRSDFGVATLVGPIGDDVKLTIETEFSPK